MSGPPSRRTLLAAGLAAPLIGALGGCGPSEGSLSAGDRTRITFWSALRGSQEVVAAFNASQDRIHVDFEQVPTGTQGGYAKLGNAARAGNAPDVATIEYPQLPGFAIDGVARDLNDLVTDDLRAQLLPQALERTTFDGRLYSVPLDLAPMVLHYRKDVFDHHGLRAPRTWAEFADLGRTIRDRVEGSRITAFPTDGASQFAAFVCQAGGQWFDIRDDAWRVAMTDAPTRRVAEYWQGLIDEGLVHTTPTNSQQYNAQVSDGSILTRLTGSWDAGAQMNARPGQAGQWAVAPLPQWEEDDALLSDHGGSTFAVSTDSARPEAAMEFIAWQVAHPDAFRARLSAGTSTQFPAAPALVDVGREALDPDYYDGQDLYSLFDAEAAKVRDDWVWGPRMSSTFQVMHDNFARVGPGRMSVLDAVAAAQEGTIPDLHALGLNVHAVHG
ncbi:ABC transporter substrate-binding protein [Nocardiopsis sp. MG754419]|uniref:ABC transporter substrate-binding protein n=1 Tax=Nocardiopsis sp. MG754419 TaxID=2259865 RepID=UPI001BAD2969|nr:sugar ABC transporter substrate-binding protein [Nocardiopsis sp. MG754419]MBR8740132.1 sugar ABC transporter substrate-binding protein [Nocardiopsis sp. MG754419]